MEYRVLEKTDARQFSELILDMYKHLESLEWFTPMPFDEIEVAEFMSDPRFYILGIFDNGKLCAVGSLDYDCGNLTGKIDFPKECDTSKLVEFGFTMVHSSYRGRGILKTMIKLLLDQCKELGYTWAFSKVHKDNLASSTSFIRCDFNKYCDYHKPVKIKHLNKIIQAHILNSSTEEKITERIKTNIDDTYIYVDYEIFMRRV